MMNTTKKFLVGLLVALSFSFATVVHAEEVDPYFSWEIKNLDDYQKSDALFKEIHNKNNVSMREELYKRIALGRYFEAAILCRAFEPYQKIALGTDYFDEGLTELTAKLYLEVAELDKAEQKINFLLKNAPDERTKISALVLKSDLYNRKGNYQKALKVAQEAEQLLKKTPDKRLRLINLSLAARAFCELGENQKAASNHS